MVHCVKIQNRDTAVKRLYCRKKIP